MVKTKLTPKTPTPYFTYALIWINVIIFYLENHLGGSKQMETLYHLGALVQEETLQGEWWRVVTANFLHFGLSHLLTNMLGLYILGIYVESLLGKIPYIIVYLFSGVGAMSLYLYWSLHAGISKYLMVGASAAIMGLVGAITAFFLKTWFRERTPKSAQGLQQMIFLIILQFALDQLIPQISSLSHLFGLIIGFILGLILGKRKKLNLRRVRN